jgi:hypothetical protein
MGVRKSRAPTANSLLQIRGFSNQKLIIFPSLQWIYWEIFVSSFSDFHDLAKLLTLTRFPKEPDQLCLIENDSLSS